MKKNLVLLIPQMYRGGAERVVSRLSSLLKNDYNIKVVVFDDSRISYDLDCEIISLNVPPQINSTWFSKIINVVLRVYRYSKFKRTYQTDITYSFGDTANIINILSFGNDKKITSIRGFKRVKTGKNFTEKFITKPVSKFIANKSNKIVSVSELISYNISYHYNISKDKIITSYNGYDIANILKKSEENIEQEVSDFIQNKKVIISAGTFRHEKGYWHLLKSFYELKKINDKAVLLILGEDYNGEKLKSDLLTTELKLEDSVMFLGYKKNPYKYFNVADTYVLSSVFEGFPNAMVEAMACSLPIVATDCPSGPREILEPSLSLGKKVTEPLYGEFGCLVPKFSEKEDYRANEIHDEHKSTAEVINKLLTDQQINSFYRNQSLKRANQFSYESWLKKQVEILN
ncbi:glycosyltransferase [Exiguobacterium sp. s70]|uniref:glycosyltransferase n=1 Tax=Exiguobacterium sp. s70 TaxID=2751228 RepID=UPI001BE6A689|nr:glycosyltransferase [Exiguobacterium sp. s70]